MQSHSEASAVLVDTDVTIRLGEAESECAGQIIQKMSCMFDPVVDYLFYVYLTIDLIRLFLSRRKLRFQCVLMLSTF